MFRIVKHKIILYKLKNNDNMTYQQRHESQEMTPVTYEQYIHHIGFAAYVYQHSYTPDSHTTDVFTLNGRRVAKIVRSEETQYFIG